MCDTVKPSELSVCVCVLCVGVGCSWWFNVGLVLLGVCLSLATFCIVYLEWFKGIQHYDQEYPAIPPITTAAFIAASIRSVNTLHQFTLESHIQLEHQLDSTFVMFRMHSGAYGCTNRALPDSRAFVCAFFPPGASQSQCTHLILEGFLKKNQ